MNTITFPLKLRMQGPKVAALQDALRLLLDRGVIPADDAAARRKLSVALDANVNGRPTAARRASWSASFRSRDGCPSAGRWIKPHPAR
ncbi:MAG: hypothetical protein C4293_20225 [Nitrospiraceae bacterium]